MPKSVPASAPSAAGAAIDAAGRRRLLGVLFAGSGMARLGFIAAVSVAPLAAEDMLGSATFSGLASAAATVGIALGTTPTAALMERHGRRPGMVGGMMTATVGVAICAAAVGPGWFPLFLLGMFVFGAGSSADRLSRYAAADLVPPHRASSAIGLVVWAGTIGSVGGPALLRPVERAAESIGLDGLTGPYLLAAIVVTASAVLSWALLRPDPLDVAAAGRVISPPDRTGWMRALRGVLSLATARYAVASLVIGQVVMVLIMTMTPVHIRHAGEDLGIVGLVVSAHTLGMFAFSPLTGWLAARMGRVPVVAAGQVLLVVSGVMAAFAAGDDRWLLVGSLFLLGLGWNFGFVSGSALLTEGLPPESRVRLQGVVDSLVWISGASASASSGLILALGGYTLLGFMGAGLVAVPVAVFLRDRVPAPARAG